MATGSELASERLRLRPCAERDVDALLALWTDPAVRRWLWDDVVIPRTVAAERVDASIASFARAEFGLWVAAPRAGGALIGVAGLVELEPAVGPELIYALAPAHWGRGYATEASRVVLAHAFGRLGFERVPGRTDPPNRESARVLERLGMRLESERAADGRPMLCYALRREEFALPGA